MTGHGDGDGDGADLGLRLQRSIMELLSQRSPTSTICPSEAARAVGGEEWRDLMDEARSAASRLVAGGEVEITQRGAVVDLATARGPVRIRRRTL